MADSIILVLSTGASYNTLDGVTWSNLFTTTITNQSFSTAFFNNALWFIGTNGTVYNSIDGVNWTIVTNSASFGTSRTHASTVVFNNKLWIIGGMNNSSKDGKCYSSTDGSTWTQVTTNNTPIKRMYHSAVVFDTKIWVMGGNDSTSFDTNTFASSSDGITWTTGTASWGIRSHHASVVFDNKIWVMGGAYDEYGTLFYLNDVWYSTNGTAWTQASASATWSVRRYHKAIAFNNKMWILGGYTGAGNSNQVWYSTNGTAWTQASALPVTPQTFSVEVGALTPAYTGKLLNILGESVSTGSLDFLVIELQPALSIGLTADSVSTGTDIAIRVVGDNPTAIQGYVMLDGVPVSNAIVQAIEQESGVIYTEETDGEGFYYILTLPGTYHVTCRFEDVSGNKYTSKSQPWVITSEV